MEAVQVELVALRVAYALVDDPLHEALQDVREDPGWQGAVDATRARTATEVAWNEVRALLAWGAHRHDLTRILAPSGVQVVPLAAQQPRPPRRQDQSLHDCGAVEVCALVDYRYGGLAVRLRRLGEVQIAHVQVLVGIGDAEVGDVLADAAMDAPHETHRLQLHLAGDGVDCSAPRPRETVLEGRLTQHQAALRDEDRSAISVASLGLVEAQLRSVAHRPEAGRGRVLGCGGEGPRGHGADTAGDIEDEHLVEGARGVAVWLAVGANSQQAGLVVVPDRPGLPCQGGAIALDAEGDGAVVRGARCYHDDLARARLLVVLFDACGEIRAAWGERELPDLAWSKRKCSIYGVDV
mmetsp:Transcript_82179/g.238265  ORF Transcript_82179/g.238265 Transcript_82179/m.238265 type:complete len:352 (+) Transcript_82179:2066-3121(+)